MYNLNSLSWVLVFLVQSLCVSKIVVCHYRVSTTDKLNNSNFKFSCIISHPYSINHIKDFFSFIIMTWLSMHYVSYCPWQLIDTLPSIGLANFQKKMFLPEWKHNFQLPYSNLIANICHCIPVTCCLSALQWMQRMVDNLHDCAPLKSSLL